MKKSILSIISTIIAVICMAGPHSGGPRNNSRPMGHGPAPIHGPRIQHTPPPKHNSHHHSSWGHGGSNFWPGFIGGVVGSAFIAPPPPKPVIVTQPVVVPSQPTVIVHQPIQVWVAGRYIDQVQPNGTVIRVWQPGHYEYR